jgi:Rap guanine nucleotide exchange factor 5
MIKIAIRCHENQNFNTALGILSGLNLVSVSRLKATWEVGFVLIQLVEPKRMKQLTVLEDLFAPMGNYKKYRAIAETVDTTRPHIPIFSLLLKDIFFIHEGNPTFQDGVLINLSKFNSIIQKINKFFQFTKQEYTMKDGMVSYSAEEYCANLRTLKEQALYKYSCLCEPKEGDETLKLRSKWMQD